MSLISSKLRPTSALAGHRLKKNRSGKALAVLGVFRLEDTDEHGRYEFNPLFRTLLHMGTRMEIVECARSVFQPLQIIRHRHLGELAYPSLGACGIESVRGMGQYRPNARLFRIGEIILHICGINRLRCAAPRISREELEYVRAYGFGRPPHRKVSPCAGEVAAYLE